MWDVFCLSFPVHSPLSPILPALCLSVAVHEPYRLPSTLPEGCKGPWKASRRSGYSLLGFPALRSLGMSLKLGVFFDLRSHCFPRKFLLHNSLPIFVPYKPRGGSSIPPPQTWSRPWPFSTLLSFVDSSSFENQQSLKEPALSLLFPAGSP